MKKFGHLYFGWGGERRHLIRRTAMAGVLLLLAAMTGCGDATFPMRGVQYSRNIFIYFRKLKLIR